MSDNARDDELLALLGRALHRAEPIPGPVHEAALAALGFCDPDAALAELTRDSLAGVRDEDGGPLVFDAGAVEIAVTVERGRIVGQLAPAGACGGALESARSASVDFRADDLGRFAVDAPPGPLRVVVEHPAGRVRTEWFNA